MCLKPRLHHYGQGQVTSPIIVKKNPEWPVDRISDAINGEKETMHILKNKILIYIGYLTTCADDKGDIHFYEDIYDKDEKLAALIAEE